MKTNYKAPDSKRVQVTYSENEKRITTVGELREKFKNETKSWRDTFFNNLCEGLYAKTAYAEYHILLD